jgi:cellulose synthase/poly-beta-1,6-N-acetylglucosamine synthase-like glycosyltransferase
VIIPCRNEAGFIDQCLDSLLANDIDQSRLQVLVIDGQSTDGTRDTVRAYAERYPFVTMLDNPKRHTPTALNIGIDHAEGEVIVRLDAHAVYPKDYVRRLVESLHRYEADNVGGAMRAVSRSSSLLGRALAAVSSHPFGVGNAHFRIGAEAPREVDTVPFGCYRRDVFDRVGRFNEHLTRSQDYDFNLRLRRAGGRIVLVPDIVCEYLIRSTIADFGRHRLRDGFWLLYPLRFGVKTYGPRHLVPAAFVLGIIALASFSWPFLRSIWEPLCWSRSESPAARGIRSLPWSCRPSSSCSTSATASAQSQARSRRCFSGIYQVPHQLLQFQPRWLNDDLPFSTPIDLRCRFPRLTGSFPNPAQWSRPGRMPRQCD